MKVHEIYEICLTCNLLDCKNAIKVSSIECNDACEVKEGIHIKVINSHECKCKEHKHERIFETQSNKKCAKCSTIVKDKKNLLKIAGTAAALGAVSYGVIKLLNKEEDYIDELE